MRGASPEVLPQVDGYRVDGVLGRGASGVVYRVWDRDLDRGLALKLLTDDRDEESRARFRIEAQAAARVIHPNVVQVYGAGEHEGRPYILQELVEGLPVSDLLSARGQLSVAATIELGLQAAEGLAEAARMGVLHRDVKPHNLLLTEGGQLKLADFGLAKLLYAPSGLTEDGTTLGTPHYMSPEQGQGWTQDHRSDQYALGATLYHLLAGHPPFDGDTALGILMKHAQLDLPSLSEACPECSPGLVEVVQRMLAKSPEQRFDSFEHVVSALEALQVPDGRDEVEALSQVGLPVLEPGPSWSVPRRWSAGVPIFVGVAALAVVLAAQRGGPGHATTTGRTVLAPPAPRAYLNSEVREPQDRDPFLRTAPAPRPESPSDPRLRERSTAELLTELRRGPNRSLRAAEELGRRADHAATFPLLHALRTSRSSARADAMAQALAQLGDIRALEPLRALSTEGRSEAVRRAAERAHRALYRVEE